MDRQEMLAQKETTLCGFANVTIRFRYLEDATINSGGIVIQYAQHATGDTGYPVFRILGVHKTFKRFPEYN